MLFHTLQRLSIDNSCQSSYNTGKHLYITLQKEAVSQLKEHNIVWQLRIRREKIVFYWFASNWCFLNMVIRTNPAQWVLFFGDSPKWKIYHYCRSIALQQSLKSTRNNIHNPFHLFYPLGIEYIVKKKMTVAYQNGPVWLAVLGGWFIWLYISLYMWLYTVSLNYNFLSCNCDGIFHNLTSHLSNATLFLLIVTISHNET